MPQPPDSDPKLAARNKRLALICGVVFAGMVGMAFAAVPFYRAFCQAVAFDTNVRGLAWDFTPNVPSQVVKLGDSKLAFFKVTNTSDQPLTGRAVYNVTPGSAGYFFSKLECFCFTNQTLAPHQTAEFPVVYYVDPRFGLDDDTRAIKQITLSYTFFPAKPLAANASQGYSTPQGTTRPGGPSS